MKKGKIRKAVFVVTYRIENSKPVYLLLKRKLHWKGWEFVKGGMDKGETALQAVKREIFEETGQKAANIKKYKFRGYYKYNREFADRKGVSWQSYALFSAELKKDKVKIDKLEHASYKWMPFENALKKLTWQNQKKCLKIVNKKIK